MDAKKVNKRGTLRIMQEVTLSQLLVRARGELSLREMARRCLLPVMTVQRIETEAVELPSKETLKSLARGYVIPLDDLARAAYGVLFEEVPEGSDDTHLEKTSPVESNSDGAWSHTEPKSRRVTAPIS